MIVRFRIHAFVEPRSDPAGLAIAKKRGIDSVILPYQWNGAAGRIDNQAIRNFTPHRPFLTSSLMWAQSPRRDRDFSPRSETDHTKWLLTQTAQSTNGWRADSCVFIENGNRLRNPIETLAVWRNVASQIGYPITICNVINGDEKHPGTTSLGFDWTIRRISTPWESNDPFELQAWPFGEAPGPWQDHIAQQIEDGVITCLRTGRDFLPLVVDNWSAASAKHSEHLAGILEGMALAPADQGVQLDGTQAKPPSALYSRL